jgi:positive regulator of sigma E activity
MKRLFDKSRSERQLKPGDWVFLKLHSQRLLHTVIVTYKMPLPSTAAIQLCFFLVPVLLFPISSSPLQTPPLLLARAYLI